MADSDKHSRIRDAAAGVWELLFKAINYLLLAHGAGLVTSLTVLKEYRSNPQLHGIGFFIAIFALGLLCTIVLLVLVMAENGGYLRKTAYAEPVAWPFGRGWMTSIGLLASFSLLLLIGAIVLAVTMFSGL